MTIPTVSETQSKAAKVVGTMYLYGFVAAFDEMFVRGRLIFENNVQATAQSIIGHELLFRIGIAVDLVEMASIVVLLTGLFVILKAVNQNLALVAALWRLMEAVICVVMTLSSFAVLRVLSSDDYLRVIQSDHVYSSLAWIYLGAHDDGYNVAEIFLGLGSTVFSYLWYKSRYIPRSLAVCGVFSSVLVAISTLAFVVSPGLADAVGLACYAPIAIFELTLGLWLLFKGLKPSEVALDKPQSV